MEMEDWPERRGRWNWYLGKWIQATDSNRVRVPVFDSAAREFDWNGKGREREREIKEWGKKGGEGEGELGARERMSIGGFGS